LVRERNRAPVAKQELRVRIDPQGTSNRARAGIVPDMAGRTPSAATMVLARPTLGRIGRPDMPRPGPVAAAKAVTGSENTTVDLARPDLSGMLAPSSGRVRFIDMVPSDGPDRIRGRNSPCGCQSAALFLGSAR
jgi:hypothetical protein